MSSLFSAPENFINRELSWLQFNRRVLEEAEDATQPLLERVKFLGIFSSNLDEFFQVRVAGIKQQIESGAAQAGPDGIAPAELFQRIQKAAHELVEKQYALWNNDIAPALASEKIRIHPLATLGTREAAWARQFFVNEVFPILTPLAVDASHPFPQVLNCSHNLIVRARRKDSEQPLHAIVQVPRIVRRLIRMPARKSEPERRDYLYLSALITHFIADLFPALVLDGVHAFRVTRNSELYIEEEDAENLLRTIEVELRRSARGNAVRLEVEQGCPPDFQQLLLERFQLRPDDLYFLNGPLTMLHLGAIYDDDTTGRLKDRPFVPVYDPALSRAADAFEVMRRQDVLLHHPYESFGPIVSLLEEAAADPQVLAIKMTLYRTSGDSPVISALIAAARNGKQVTAVVELKARFDEANNIQWARRLEEAGAHVVYGVIGLKTHCKALLIVRRDEDEIRQYVHLGTGNYHPRTARAYTDFSLLTTNKEMCQEVATLFNTLTGLAEYPGFKKLLVAPFDLCTRLKGKIERERDHARAGKPARIIAKLNSLVDEDIITVLYEASAAGVKVDLIVRGICCLRPGVPGVSENIRVVSIVGRFLEHSRIYYFGNDGEPEVYLASADWMPRNFHRRVEIAFPIEDPALRRELSDEVLPAYLSDRVKARQLQASGSYVRLKPKRGEPPSQVQLFFRERARLADAALDGTLPIAATRLTPATAPAEARLAE